MTTTSFDPETIAIGVVGRPHGVRGELLLRPYNTRDSALEQLDSLILERDGVRTEYQIESLRGAAEAVIAKLAGIDDRDAAAALTLSLVRVPRAALPPLAPGEYYVEDVVGCAVVDRDERPLGVAAGTFWNGAHDVMTVEGGDGRERMVPLVPEFVLEVDAPRRKIRVDWHDDDVDE
jgi:16S rRNA processing protein RimM